jgi:egghead protein (zeste-white 4 protein)
MTTAPTSRPPRSGSVQPLPVLRSLYQGLDPAPPDIVPADTVGGPAATAVVDTPPTSVLPAVPVPPARPSTPVLDVVRPWAPWRVRLTFVLAFLVLGVPILAVTWWMWERSKPAHGAAGDMVDAASFIWVLLAVPVVLNVIGAVTFADADCEDGDQSPIANLVCFRVVTRGTNVDAVLKTVGAVEAEMARTPLFPYVVEVVSDNPLPLTEGATVRVLLVPREYRTEHGARFKARALHYALEASPIGPTTWLFHLDEETHLTPSVIWGIRNAVLDEEATGALRIGQGVVLYHRDLDEHPLLTLADSVRTGDDLGRFRLQHCLGQTPFGMHGSFILVRNDVEREVGFDLGPDGSVTEDAWWSLVEMAQGRRSRWVDGYCLEQSTRSVTDFIKQRRRWFVGLVLVCLRAPARRWHRVALISSIALWGVSWLGWWSVAVAAIVVDVRIPALVFLTGSVSLAAYSALYLLGLELNLVQRGVPWVRRIPWYVAQVVLLPVFSLLESSAVIYGVVRPDVNFHVVKK